MRDFVALWFIRLDGSELDWTEHSSVVGWVSAAPVAN